MMSNRSTRNGSGKKSCLNRNIVIKMPITGIEIAKVLASGIQQIQDSILFFRIFITTMCFCYIFQLILVEKGPLHLMLRHVQYQRIEMTKSNLDPMYKLRNSNNCKT